MSRLGFLSKLGAVLGMCCITLSAVSAAEVPLKVEKVNERVYALVGELDQRSAENYANNATFGLVITDEGAVLIDSGGSYQGAAQLAKTVQTLTSQPIKWVVNTGGQDHRWLGNGYFKAQGATIITSEVALKDQQERASQQLSGLREHLGATLDKTEPVYADTTFATEHILTVGGVEMQLKHLGAAHTVGDLLVWLPAEKILFSGDIVFVERALGTGPAQNVASWLKVFEQMMAYEPQVIIPGHGGVATPAKAKADTYDYLSFLREAVGKLIAAGGDQTQAAAIDQSQFSYLKVFDRISKRNAEAVFGQMEFE